MAQPVSGAVPWARHQAWPSRAGSPIGAARGGRTASSTRSTRARSPTANGDGVGDLEGIRRRLDHLAWLGVDAHLAVADLPLADGRLRLRRRRLLRRRPGLRHARRLRPLLADAHARGHAGDARLGAEPHAATSTRGSSSRGRRATTRSATGTCGATAPRRRAAEQLARPSFGGRAWTLDDATGQYYLHLFLAEQPDLNWATPRSSAAMHDVLRFWLDRGVDGFRVDVVHLHRQGPGAARPSRRGGRAARPSLPPRRPAHARAAARHPARARRATRATAHGRRGQPRSSRAVAPYYGRGDELHLVFNFALAARAVGRGARGASAIERVEAALRPPATLADVGALEPRHAPASHPLRRRRGAGARRGRRCC